MWQNRTTVRQNKNFSHTFVQMSSHSNIILASTLLGSVYLFSASLKQLDERYARGYSVDILGTTVMCCSGAMLILSGLKSIEILMKTP
jgi:hypothetical protein